MPVPSVSLELFRKFIKREFKCRIERRMELTVVTSVVLLHASIELAGVVGARGTLFNRLGSPSTS